MTTLDVTQKRKASFFRAHNNMSFVGVAAMIAYNLAIRQHMFSHLRISYSYQTHSRCCVQNIDIDTRARFIHIQVILTLLANWRTEMRGDFHIQ